MKQSEREQWFLDSVGKRVWRSNINILQTHRSSYLIEDTEKASYFYWIELIFNRGLTPVKFFDSPEERDEFELTLKNDNQ